MFKHFNLSALFLTAFTVLSPAIHADDEFTKSEAQMTQNVDEAEYDVTLAAFKNSKVGNFFEHAYGYAVFPTIGKVGFSLVALLVKVVFMKKVVTLVVQK